ncbi:tautomerase family protein [Dyella halodurans]|uniref:Tautomerase family protein n=1 Tax=Dyella halodurans TaxID=1920171 RepID=A0ABV9C529_9GAMM|nr:tautomerase family protein [Dyella halodurans]
MAILTIDLRSWRSDERLPALAAGLIDAVSKLTGEPRDQVVLIIHDGAGHHLVENNDHLAAVPDIRSDA